MLNKPHTSGIRPLVLQPCWLKIWHSAIARRLVALFEDALPSQMGVGRGSGCALMHGILQSCLEEESNPVILQLDIENAFSTIHRGALLDVLQNHLPSDALRPWFPHLQTVVSQPSGCWAVESSRG